MIYRESIIGEVSVISPTCEYCIVAGTPIIYVFQSTQFLNFVLLQCSQEKKKRSIEIHVHMDNLELISRLIVDCI